VSHDAHLAVTVSTKFEVDTTIRCLVIALSSPIGYHWQERAGHLEARFQGEGVIPLPIYWYHSKGNWFRYNFVSISYGWCATRQNVSRLAAFGSG